LGDLDGQQGAFDGSTYTIRNIEVAEVASPNVVSIFLRAILPTPISVPAGLIKDGKLKDASTIEQELAAMAADARRRIQAEIDAAARRLRTIEIDWQAGAFLGAAGSLKARGEAKLHLDVLTDKTLSVPTSVAGEFRAGFELDVAVTAGGATVT